MGLTQRHVVASHREDEPNGKAVAVLRVADIDEETSNRRRRPERALEHSDFRHGSRAVPSSSLDVFELVPSPPSPTSNRQARLGTGSGGEL